MTVREKVRTPSHLKLEPDTSNGAFVGCECSDCREARLQDNERIVYGARDVADAYRRGYEDALQRVLGRIDDLRQPTG